jgi:hypothetical protein
MLEKYLEKYKQAATLELVIKAVRELQNTEVISFLRMKGRTVLQIAANPIENAALSGTFSAGYQACLDDLEDFASLVQPVSEGKDGKKAPTADFGAKKFLINNNLMTEEEYGKLNQ